MHSNKKTGERAIIRTLLTEEKVHKAGRRADVERRVNIVRRVLKFALRSKNFQKIKTR